MPRVTPTAPKVTPRGSASRAVVRSPRILSDRPSRWRLLLRRQRHLAWPAAYVVGGVALLGVVGLLVRSAAPERRLAGWREALGSMVPMHVQQVVVQGRANTPEPVLRAALGVIPGQPILAFSVADARARIETLAWVQHATVERRLPGTIVVQLEERRPFAIWQNQGHFALIDRAGQVVADQDIATFRQLPLVVGAGAPEHAAALLDALAAQPALQSRVTAAVRVGERRWNLVLSNGLNVFLPEGQAPAALARLMELQASQALLDHPLQIVDMRLPDRLVLRPRADAPFPGQAVMPSPLQPAKKPT